MPYLNFFFDLSRNIENIVIAGGYPFLFIIVVLEGVPLLGTAVPGHISIILAGFLARLGIFNLYWVLIIVMIAALLGDFIGFWLGRKYGMSLITRLSPYFFIKQSHIEKAKKMLDSHTGKALIIGRFSPVTRALMPFLVGTGEIKAGKFWVFNIVGGGCWVILSVLLGYVFGEGFHIISGYFGKFAVVSIIVSLLIIWAYKFINSRFHIFAKYELFNLGLNIASIILLAKTIQDAWASQSFMANFDVVVNLFMNKINHAYPIITYIATFITNIGGMVVLMVLGIVFGIVLLFRQKWRIGIIFLLSTTTTAFSLGILKEFFMRLRPDNALITIVNDPSFPSGHAAMAATFFVVFMYMAVPKIKSLFKRELLIIFCTLSVIAIGLSRVVLNVHWASDVIGGWSLGVFIATSYILLVRYIGVLVVRKK
ncbi:MAG: bifunctional DedA family/phosphatase PAP2 family protein [Candidatus Taylorbacteria bacterium]